MLLFLLWTAPSYNAFAQPTDSLQELLSSTDTTISADTSAVQNTEEKTTFTLGVLYSNNVNYYGHVAAEKMPYVALAGSVRFPHGFYITGLAYKLFNDSLAVSAFGLGAGYEFDIAKNLTGDVSYHHTFFPKNSPFIQASSPGLISAVINYEHLFSTSLTADYAFGKQSDYFFTLGNSKGFDIYMPDNKSIFTVTPGIDIIAGTQQYYETYITERKNNGKGIGSGNNPGKGNPNPNSGTTIEERSFSKFGLMSYNFKLPISFSRANYLAELEYQFSLLAKNAVLEGLSDNHSFVTLSFYYQF